MFFESTHSFLLLFFSAGAVVISGVAAVYDIRTRTIPNELVLSGTVFALFVGISFDVGGQLTRIGTAFCLGGLFIVVAFLSPDGLGMGDAKLVFTLSLWLGYKALTVVLIALILALLVGLIIAMRRSTLRLRELTLPFAPYLAAGCLLSLFFTTLGFG